MIHNPSQRGFSLIEVLVAITLLLMVIVGPMQMLKQTSNSTSYANEQMVAYFLAQEGIELVQKRRDDLLLEYFRQQFLIPPTSYDPMNQFSIQNNTNPLSQCFNTTVGCGLYMNNDGSLDFVKNNNNPSNCVANRCRLYLSSGTENTRSRYTHVVAPGNEETPYTRRIQIERTDYPNDYPVDHLRGLAKEFKVTSIVEWRTGSLIGGQRVELVTYIQNIHGTE